VVSLLKTTVMNLLEKCALGPCTHALNRCEAASLHQPVPPCLSLKLSCGACEADSGASPSQAAGAPGLAAGSTVAPATLAAAPATLAALVLRRELGLGGTAMKKLRIVILAKVWHV
jgi:hypothetical protein